MSAYTPYVQENTSSGAAGDEQLPGCRCRPRLPGCPAPRTHTPGRQPPPPAPGHFFGNTPGKASRVPSPRPGQPPARSPPTWLTQRCPAAGGGRKGKPKGENGPAQPSPRRDAAPRLTAALAAAAAPADASPGDEAGEGRGSPRRHRGRPPPTPLPGRPEGWSPPPRPHSQDAGAGGAHEAAHRHVGVGGAALVAVEALAVGREATHLPQQLQVLLLLLPLGAGGHGPASQGTARHGAGPRSHTPRRRRRSGARPAGEGEGRGGEGNRRPPMSRGGSAVAARSGRPAAPREGAGRGPRQRRPAAAPGPGRLNDEPRRDLRDTFMRSGKEMAAAEPNAGGSAPSRAGGRTPLPPPPRPGGAAAAGAVSPGVTRRGRERGGDFCGERCGNGGAPRRILTGKSQYGPPFPGEGKGGAAPSPPCARGGLFRRSAGGRPLPSPARGGREARPLGVVQPLGAARPRVSTGASGQGGLRPAETGSPRHGTANAGLTLATPRGLLNGPRLPKVWKFSSHGGSGQQGLRQRWSWSRLG